SGLGAVAAELATMPGRRVTATSSTERQNGIDSIRRANDDTGTDISAVPRSPLTLRITRIEPYSISQRLEVNRFGSVEERCARSGTGAYFDPGPVSRATEVLTWLTSLDSDRMFICARPGITCGIITV